MHFFSFIQSVTQSVKSSFVKLPQWAQIWIGGILNIIVVVYVFIAIRTFIFLPYTIKGISMESTFHEGEVIYVDRLSPVISGFDYGQVIVFVPPTQHGKTATIEETGLMCLFEKTKNIFLFQGKKDPCRVKETYIKRIIALPGDTVEVKNGHVFVTKKGEKQPIQVREDFLLEKNRNKTCVPAQKCSGLFVLASEAGKSFGVVPEGKYFVLGDNRVNSSDSRANAWDTPFVAEENIIGIVRAVYLSPKPVADHGSFLANYWAAIKNIPESFKDIRFIGDNDILEKEL